MTGAPDGDVDRALASINATPLKYHSFGVVSVRPPNSQSVGSDGARTEAFSANGRSGDAYGAPASGLPPTGEGTTGRYRARAVSTVFPLLGLALPEAFQIDVEPIWPVGPPVSDQGMLLDRPPLRQHGYSHSDYGAPYEAPATDAWAAKPPSFSMPPWLDPLPPANPLHQLPDEPFAAADPRRNFPAWDGPGMAPPSLRSSETGRARRLNMWGDELGDNQPGFSGRVTQAPSDDARPFADHLRPVPSSDFSPFGRNGVGVPAQPPPTVTEPPSWLNQELSGGRSSIHEKPGAAPISDWTLPLAHPVPHMHTPAAGPERVDPPPEFSPAELAPPVISEFDDQPALSPSLPMEGLGVDHAPIPHPAIDGSPIEHTAGQRHEEFMSHQAPLHEPIAAPEPSAAMDMAGPESFIDATHNPAPDPYAPSLYQPFDADPTWHDAPVVHHSLTDKPHDPAADPVMPPDPTAGSGMASWLRQDDATRETTPPPRGAAPTSAKGRPLADMFRTLGAGAPRSHSGSS